MNGTFEVYFPHLHRCLTNNTVYRVHDTYIGIASDGDHVHIGQDLQSTERYLADHPTPDTW